MGLKDYFVFDGEASSDFGFYVSGEATFNAPEKEYETFSVPGKSGDLQSFTGRYKNITVTYKCFYRMHGGNFARDIAGFRNLLLSRDGYVRLEDTHHPEEFRLGIYKGGLEVNPTDHNVFAIFNIKFDCMPQRFLKSGEEPLTDPGTDIWNIKNPTLFPAKPLIEIYGHGQLRLNGYCLEVKDLKLGIIDLVDYERQQTNYAGGETSSSLIAYFIRSDFQNYNDAHLDAKWWIAFTVDGAKAGTITVTEQSTSDEILTTTRSVNGEGLITVGLSCNGDTFFMGQTGPANYSAVIRVNYTDTSNVDQQVDVTVSVSATLNTNSIELSSVTLTSSGATLTSVRETKQVNYFKVRSTVSALGNPLYVDMETGDAYKVVDGETIYVNHIIWVGENLPVLEPGDTEVVPDSETGMTVRIIPRWWTL